MANSAGSSVEIEQRTPAARRARSGCSSRARHHPGAQVGDGSHVEHDATLGELHHERRVLDGADAVADAIGMQGVERAADRGRSGGLAGVRHRAETQRAGEAEGGGERFGGVLGPAEADGYHTAVAVASAPVTVSSAIRGLNARVMSGVRLISTPVLSRASWAPSQ